MTRQDFIEKVAIELAGDEEVPSIAVKTFIFLKGLKRSVIAVFAQI